MNGRWAHALTIKERMAIVFIKAIDRYFREHPQGVIPGEGYIMNFIDPFLEYERIRWRNEDKAKNREAQAQDELNSAELEAHLYQICLQRISAQPGT
jgi:hypothetical protein